MYKFYASDVGKVEQQEIGEQVIIFKDYSCGEYNKNMRNIEWSESQNKIIVKHENNAKTEEEKYEKRNYRIK